MRISAVPLQQRTTSKINYRTNQLSFFRGEDRTGKKITYRKYLDRYRDLNDEYSARPARFLLQMKTRWQKHVLG
jgi:hypothetical protein